MHRSYVAKEWLDNFLENNRHPLPDEVATRFFGVLRIKPHEEVGVFDGSGREVSGLIEKLDKKTCVFSRFLVRTLVREKPEIVVVQAALEESSIAETIKRGSENGVDRFIIFNAERSAKFCFDKLNAKRDRLERIAQDACRQSGRLFVPTIVLKESLSAAVHEVADVMSLGVFGDVAENILFSHTLRAHGEVLDAFCLVVGPEGGLTPPECDKLRKSGFLGVRFAPYVLRSELACIAAVAIFNAFCGRA